MFAADFKEIIGDSAKLHFNDPREFVGVGNISWPEKPRGDKGTRSFRCPLVGKLSDTVTDGRL